MGYDALVVVALWFVTTALIYGLSAGLLAAPDRPFWLLGLHRFALLAVTCGFFMWFWTHGGQTLGMRAWRVRVAANDGGAITRTQAAIRLMAALLSLLPGGLGYFWSLVDREGRTWHDRLSGTHLVLVPKPR